MGEVTEKLVSARHLAERTGKSVRYFQKLAAAGVTWASQPGGKGAAWMFQESGFEKWLAAGCKVGGKWRTSTSAGKTTTPAPRTTAKNTENPLRQRLEQLLKSDCRSGLRG